MSIWSFLTGAPSLGPRGFVRLSLLVLATVASLWSTSTPAQAMSMLDQLVQMQRRSYAGACITSGFWDPRGVSRYRSRPGIHLGYDIAMPYGSPVRVCWPGTITSIVPWAQGEWGVTVTHSDGTTATYGHVQPLGAQIGQQVLPGQIIAQIASDHLDVKMRDPRGVHFDYAQKLGDQQLTIDTQWIPTAPMLPSWPTPQALELQSKLRRALQARDILRPEARSPLGRNAKVVPTENDETLERLQEVCRGKKLTWEKADRQQFEQLGIQFEKIEQLYQAGLVSDKEWQRIKKRWDCWKALFV